MVVIAERASSRALGGYALQCGDHDRLPAATAATLLSGALNDNRDADRQLSGRRYAAHRRIRVEWRGPSPPPGRARGPWRRGTRRARPRPGRTYGRARVRGVRVRHVWTG